MTRMIFEELEGRPNLPPKAPKGWGVAIFFVYLLVGSIITFNYAGTL